MRARVYRGSAPPLVTPAGGEPIATSAARPSFPGRAGRFRTSDEALVAAVRAGDDRAFEELYARYQRKVNAYVRGMVRDRGRAEDLTQEIFLSALRRMRDTERPIAFKPWIYEIAKNACIDAYRRRARAEEVPVDVEDEARGLERTRLAARTPTPDAAFEEKNSLARLQGAMGGLSDAHSQILVMRELEGRSYQEIGERLGMSRPAVESTLFRARKRLGEEYEELVSGERCRLVSAIVAGVAQDLPIGARDHARMARHISYCQPCRTRAIDAGLDVVALSRRTVRSRIAGWLPLPAVVRFRRRAGGTGQHAEGAAPSAGAGAALAPYAAAVAPYAEQVTGGWLRAGAAVAAVAAAGVTAGVGSGVVDTVRGATGGGDRAGALVAGADGSGSGVGAPAGGAGPTGAIFAGLPAGQVAGGAGAAGATGATGGATGGGQVAGSGGGGGVLDSLGRLVGGSAGGGGAGGGGTGGGGGLGGLLPIGGGGSPPGATGPQRDGGGAVQQAGAIVQGAAGGTVTTATRTIGGAGSTVGTTTTTVAGTAGRVVKGAGGAVTSTVQGAGTTVGRTVRDAGQTAAKVTEPVKQTVTKVTQPVKQTVTKATEPVKRTVTKAAEPVKQTVTRTTEPAKRTVTKVTEPVTGTVTKATEPARQTVTKATEPVKGTAAKATEPVRSTVTKATEPVAPAKEAAPRVTEPVKTVSGAATKAVSDAPLLPARTAAASSEPQEPAPAEPVRETVATVEGTTSGATKGVGGLLP